MKAIIFSLFLLAPLYAPAQEVILEGTPNKIIEMDQYGSRNELPSSGSDSVRITRVGDTYFWANRNGVQMTRTESTIYVTFMAVDGSGYVTTVNDTAREIFIQAAPENIIGRYTYVEHVINGLTSKTTYGR